MLDLNLFSHIKYYLILSQKLKAQLSKHPEDWKKFQDIFNLTVDRIYGDIQRFERKNIYKAEVRVYKLKKIFEKRYKRYFLYGKYIEWCVNKPYGYSGDFKIIDDIYLAKPRTKGFERLWDNWFQQLAASCSVRERKEDFKKIISDFVKGKKKDELRIMNLASGPAREIKELVEENSEKLFSNVIFDCYDIDEGAIEYAKRLLNNVRHVNFFQKNAIRLALKKNIRGEITHKYDLIYSMGLFDYLDEKVATRLIVNLRRLLKRNGVIVVSNAAEKKNNSSAVWMEWVAEWNLIYRTEDEFRKIFLDAGITPKNLQIIPQACKVMQYCFAKKGNN